MTFKRRLIIGLISVASILLFSKAGPSWINNWGIDPATTIFLAFLSLIILFRVSSATSGSLAIAFIVFTAFFSISKYEKSAESFAIVAFFLFIISVFQGIYEIYSNRL